MRTEWRECSLGDVVELKRGYDLPQQDRRPGQVPLVSSSGVTDYHAEAKVAGPGVVTGRYGTLGQVFFINDAFWPLNTTLYVRNFKSNDPRFISYFLRTLDFRAYSDKAAVPGLNRNHLHEARIRIPADAAEQREIAHMLGALDDKIELNRRMGETLDDLVETVFRSWFLHFGPTRAKIAGRDPLGLASELAGLFPDTLEESEIGPIPRGWNVRPIGEVVSVVGGSTPSTEESGLWNGRHFFATPRDLSRRTSPLLLSTERTITDTGVERISSGVLPIGTVLLSSRAPIGYVAVTSVPVCVNQGFIAMVCDKELPTFYVSQWATSSVETFKKSAGGTTFPEINKKTFRPLPILVPGRGIVEAFERLASRMYKRLENSLREIDTIAGLRDALLPKLISGELRVWDAERMVESVT